jgi:hypothetical protein
VLHVKTIRSWCEDLFCLQDLLLYTSNEKKKSDYLKTQFLITSECCSLKTHKLSFKD